MGNSLKSSMNVVFGGLFFLGLMALPFMVIYGSVSFANQIIPILSLAAVVLFCVCLNLFLPLSFFRFTRFYASVGFIVASYVFGATLWFTGVVVSYLYWGFWGLFIGLVMAGVGVVPIAMLASALHSEWWGVGGFVIGIVLIYGTRLFGVYLGTLCERDTMPSNHSLAWLGKSYVGLIWLMIIVGYVSTLYFHGWEFFVPDRGNFNALVSSFTTMILMLPGVGIIKIGERIQRKRQAKAQAYGLLVP
jgi:hypothetical protein